MADVGEDKPLEEKNIGFIYDDSFDYNEYVKFLKAKIEGEYSTMEREMNVLLSYNSQFRHNESYFSGGSWSLNLRPDYTLSFWPKEISSEEAERQELMVHLHFDAKYKVDHFKETFGQIASLEDH